MAGMVNIRSPSISVNPSLFFTRSSPFSVYSSVIKPLLMGLTQKAVYMLKRFEHDETGLGVNTVSGQCLSYIRVEQGNYVLDTLLIHSLSPVWKSKELREDTAGINISDKIKMFNGLI